MVSSPSFWASRDGEVRVSPLTDFLHCGPTLLCQPALVLRESACVDGGW